MATATHVQHLSHALRAITALVQEREGKELKLGAAVGIIGDLGQFMAAAKPADIRTIQAKVAGVRERLRFGDSVENQPLAMLNNGKDCQLFLAGAMWAADEFLEAQLEARDTVRHQAETSQRAALRQIVLAESRRCDVFTPGDCLAAAHTNDVPAQPHHVSRALGDLLRDGVIAHTDAPADADRRNRYFTATPAPAPAE